jgi:hypothetical protein
MLRNYPLSDLTLEQLLDDAAVERDCEKLLGIITEIKKRYEEEQFKSMLMSRMRVAEA